MSADENNNKPGFGGVPVSDDLAAMLVAINTLPEKLNASEPRANIRQEESGLIYKRGAFCTEGRMVRLGRGSGGDNSPEFETVKFLQYELVVNGFLDADLIKGQEGYMKGTLTTTSVEELQKSMKNAGASITIENGSAEKGEQGGVVVFNEVWAALRAVREHGGKVALNDPEKAKLVVERYEAIKAENVQAMMNSAGKQKPYVAATDINALDLSKLEKERV